jgi:HK97 family phage major capsid protein
MNYVQQLASAKARQAAQDLATYSSIANSRRIVPGAHPDEAEFSFREFFSQLAEQGGLTRGLEREICEESARQSGTAFDMNKPTVPWACFTRASPDERVSVASQGGFLVQTDVLGVADILRPFSIVVPLGLTVLSGLKGNATIPAVKSTTTAQWLSDEASSPAESAVTLGQIALTPKTVSDFTTASRQLLIQSAADALIRNELLKTVATAIDVAIINGSGVSGQPSRILQTAGSQTVSDASIAWTGLLSMHA